MMNIVFAGFGAALLGFAAFMALGYATFLRQPVNHPTAFLRRGRVQGTKLLVACAGDSITHATVSADYVGMLRQRLGGERYEFINAGHNGDTSSDLLKRIEAITRCQPDFVTVLIGTNDARPVAHQVGSDSSGQDEIERLAMFQKNLNTIIDQMQTTTQAKITFLSIPMQGEDLPSHANQVVRQFNATIRNVCSSRKVDYLPLYEELEPLIASRSSRGMADKPLSLARVYFTPILHYVLGRNWDELAQFNHFSVLTDGLHLSRRGATMVADLVDKWLLSNR